jgi:signal transduction histidine kinase
MGFGRAEASEIFTCVSLLPINLTSIKCRNIQKYINNKNYGIKPAFDEGIININRKIKNCEPARKCTFGFKASDSNQLPRVANLTTTKADTRKPVVGMSSLLSTEALMASLGKSVNNKYQHFGLGMQGRIDMTSKLGVMESEESLTTSFPPSLISSEEGERKRISRELHDGLGQLLTSMNLKIQDCLTVATEEDGSNQTLSKEVVDALASVSFMVKQAMGEVRSICGALRPSILDDLGVLAAISWQCRQITKGCTGSRLDISTDFAVHEGMIPEEYKTAIYRVTQEALNNAIKYSQAKNISISIHLEGEQIRLCIQDDGIGFDADNLLTSKGIGMGLSNMCERVESLGGDFYLTSSAGRGVKIEAAFLVEKVALSG